MEINWKRVEFTVSYSKMYINLSLQKYNFLNFQLFWQPINCILINKNI